MQHRRNKLGYHCAVFSNTILILLLSNVVGTIYLKEENLSLPWEEESLVEQNPVETVYQEH